MCFTWGMTLASETPYYSWSFPQVGGSTTRGRVMSWRQHTGRDRGRVRCWWLASCTSLTLTGWFSSEGMTQAGGDESNVTWAPSQRRELLASSFPASWRPSCQPCTPLHTPFTSPATGMETCPTASVLLPATTTTTISVPALPPRQATPHKHHTHPVLPAAAVVLQTLVNQHIFMPSLQILITIIITTTSHHTISTFITINFTFLTISPITWVSTVSTARFQSQQPASTPDHHHCPQPSTHRRSCTTPRQPAMGWGKPLPLSLLAPPFPWQMWRRQCIRWTSSPCCLTHQNFTLSMDLKRQSSTIWLCLQRTSDWSACDLYEKIPYF